MIYNTGKTPATTQIRDGTIIQLFNNDINTLGKNMRGQIIFYDVIGNPRYMMTIPDQSIDNHYRIACFTRTLPQSTFDNIVRMAILVNGVNITQQYKIPADLLYQMISPNISRMGFDSYQLTWWCNTDQASQWMENKNVDNITIGYNKDYVKKFDNSKLTEEQPKANSGKVLCTATLKWEKLSARTQINNKVEFETIPRYYPVISSVTVLTILKNEGYITDFAVSGDNNNDSYSAINIHTHTATNDGGFAAAVFMPSAVMKPLNWS